MLSLMCMGALEAGASRHDLGARPWGRSVLWGACERPSAWAPLSHRVPFFSGEDQ